MHDNNSDAASSAASIASTSVVSQNGFTGKTTYITDGTVKQVGLLGTVRHYKAGDCIHGGFFSKTKYVPYADGRSPYVTPTSTPTDGPTSGDVPPELVLVNTLKTKGF